MASEMGLAVFVSVVGDSTVSHPYHNCVQHVNNGYTGIRVTTVALICS